MNQNQVITILAVLLAVLITLTISVSAAPTAYPPNADDNPITVSRANVVWQKIYGGSADDRAFYALPTSDGCLIAGSTESIVENNTVGWALRLDRDGNAVWNKTYLEGSGTELRFALNLTGGFLLVGNEFLPNGDVNGFVQKIDSKGAPLWNVTLGGEKIDKLLSAIATNDGFVLFGLTCSFGKGESSAWIVKLDLSGNVVWNKTYQGGLETAVRIGVMAPDGNYMAAGYTDLQGQSIYDFLLLKIDPSGNVVWHQTYSRAESQKAYSMTTAPDGYVIVGETESAQTSIDAWVVKVDFNGALLWDKTVGGRDADSPSYIAPSKDGNYLVSGFTFSYGEGNRDFWLFKIDKNGQVMWSCAQGDAAYQEAYGVIDVGENQYVMVGWTDPVGQPDLIGKATYDFSIVKIDTPKSNSGLSFSQIIAFVIVGLGVLVGAVLIAVKRRRKLRDN
jgi:hypothetical protein